MLRKNPSCPALPCPGSAFHIAEMLTVRAAARWGCARGQGAQHLLSPSELPQRLPWVSLRLLQNQPQPLPGKSSGTCASRAGRK